MLTDEQIKVLLEDIESDNVERTISTNKTDKFCQAICSFANDMPGHGKPGYLFIGADDKTGGIKGIGITDQLLQNLAGHRDSGQIVPLPSLTVQKRSFPEGDIAVVEVLPSDMPPVRYRGRVWIRVGPRRAVATEQEERILTERRVHMARSFDLLPCIGCVQDQMVLSLFQLDYRNAAIAPEIIEENERDLFQQMAALGFWDVQNNCATNAGALLFAEMPQNWFLGAYIQYVRFDGCGMEADILDERKFTGDLLTLLRELDAFIKTLFPSRPVPVSALREEQRTPYPNWAIRELLMNAVMHRNYQSNAPVTFYWFSDRIEIQNPGGLFGAVTPETFPDQNDYRNPKVAEAMKVLKYVNQFRRGIIKAQDLLRKNGNPPAEFTINQPNYFLATVQEAGS
ncbi:MAG: ATP-binding protein [Thermodesulfobacteriota bacterium]|nr:ATP-binding protein [Thermodesulfobacteriota bacterium]